MKYNNIILIFLLNIFFSIIFFNPLKADDRICGNDLTNYIYDYHDDNFEYLEKRNDAGIFFDFSWDKDNQKICLNHFFFLNIENYQCDNHKYNL